MFHSIYKFKKDSVYQLKVLLQEDALVAAVYDLRMEFDDWQSPPCETAQELWWYVDRYFLWELEFFPSRRCPEREQLREELMELVQQVEEDWRDVHG